MARLAQSVTTFKKTESVGSRPNIGGIWVEWKSYLSIRIIHNHPQFMLLHLQGNNLFNGFYIFVVYGSPDRSKRKSLWDDLLTVLPQNPLPWLILGDFNAILSPKEKKSECTVGKRCKFFGNFVDVCNLQDLGYIGPSFTWQRGSTAERLDRALANDAWFSDYPHSLVYHLPRIKSDHRPILLKTNLEIRAPKGRPFRFLAGWTKHANFKDLVSSKWSFSGNMAESLSVFTSHVKTWNRSVYGFLGTRKKKLLKSLGSIQKALDQSFSRSLATLEMDVQDELESMFNHEELLWKQKARCDWLNFGDRNTKFFHSRTIQRRKFNRILALKDNNGDWCYDQSTLSDEAVKFFENMYGENPRPIIDIPSNIFPCLKEQGIEFLNKPVLNDEIKKALFDMAPLKAPRSDGFHAHFFQSQWDLVGGTVCEWVQEELNNTLLVLIPKKDRPEDYSQFRPISLCLVMYKLVMKVIANRFKMVFLNFISPEQAGFIAGRNISDNIIIAQEVIHTMRSKKTGRQWMAIKLDLEKAYNRVSWEFIEISLIAAEIPEKIRKILWNGVPSKTFKPVRGIRQGCPLSPYLFVLCMEWLGYLINSEISAGRWRPIQLSRSGPSLSHLFFANDLVIFNRAEMDQAKLLKDILRCFCDFSGHKISVRKSNMFFSKNVDVNVGDQISQLFGFQKVLNLGNYLGVPLLHDRVTKSTLDFVIGKVRNKLQNWDAWKLSFAGRVTLAQLVILAIPCYFMQSLSIPKGVCEEIERIARQFIWGGSAGNPKTALVSWDSICQPRSHGGLGFRRLQDHNNSFLMKLCFNLVSRKDALWVRVLRSKYGWKSQLPVSIQKSHCYHIWRSLSKVWPLVYENLMWSVGDGTTIRGWEDIWIPDVGPLVNHVPAHANLNLDSTLKDWVLQDGSWNVDMMRIWLSDDIIKRIVCILHRIKLEVKTESFGLRPKDDIWKHIWKYKGPQRVRLFFWLVINQRLFTNSERARRGIGQSSACPRCGHELEDIMHVLRDCLNSKEAWKLEKGITWSCLFGIIAWRIWKSRDLFIFQSIDWSSLKLVKFSLTWAQHFETLITGSKLFPDLARGYQHCSNDWVYFYYDGAVARLSGNASAGGVVRDRNGNWILGFTHYLSRCSPFEVELWAILDGMLTLLNRGFKRVKIQTDNLEVFEALSMK
ncbi:reverse transcriptase [Gossypium australe]|uniref:Reverse transcriptase n=1 Tax=Gossypium australe TaxID=47621 RepID=A0A5B6X8J0_9ROSI|nr:reverse transcriptase [Gossypium australe]